MNDICAKEGCSEPSYKGNALGLGSPIGWVVVYLCEQHFSDSIRANMAIQQLQNRLEKEKKA